MIYVFIHIGGHPFMTSTRKQRRLAPSPHCSHASAWAWVDFIN